METGIVKLFKSCHPDYNDGGQLRDFIYIKDVENTILYFLEHVDINGIFNVGTGKARSFRDLVRAVFSALDMKTCIEYIDMPEELKGNYQNYTQADTAKLIRSGCPSSFTVLETGIEDYVINYLKPAYDNSRMNRG
jgi:ADP-L-glycero-D-manno-heptose 6-epimerase